MADQEQLNQTTDRQEDTGTGTLLLLSVFTVATCGLIYELVAGTLASYLLGDSVTQFSTIIGCYLFAMGIGSWLSKYFTKNLLGWFIQVEILVGMVGGFSSALLFLLFAEIEHFRLLLYAIVLITGMLVGLEIPLLMRVLKSKYAFHDLVSKIFTFDYIGALLASLIFPLVLVPRLGLIRTSVFFGILNVIVAIIVAHKFEKKLPSAKYQKTAGWICLFLLLGVFVLADKITSFSESQVIPGKIIHAESSPYQRIILSKDGRSLKLHLNGNLQFSSDDEYRYHESLVHPVLLSSEKKNKVLILGGGDGLAVREILKHKVDSIILVDLDPAMTELFRNNSMLTTLNQDALNNPKLQIINEDAFSWLRSHGNKYDVVIIDFPDPSNYSLGKLYSDQFFIEISKHLTPQGRGVIQSTSPYFARKSFWCVANTIAASGLNALPYHAYVPSFGEWGFILFAHDEPTIPQLNGIAEFRFVNDKTIQQMFHFSDDMSFVPTEVNRLNNQSLVHYFESEWSQYSM